MSRVMADGKGWGVNIMPSYKLFDADSGFMQDREIIVGVHISAIEMVRASFCALKQTGMQCKLW